MKQQVDITLERKFILEEDLKFAKKQRAEKAAILAPKKAKRFEIKFYPILTFKVPGSSTRS